MESGLDSWTPYGRTGQEGWYSYAVASLPDPVRTGTKCFKTYAGWNGDPNFNGAYQDKACLPTSEFTAEGWLHTKSGDSIVGTPGNGNTVWLEVTFRDATKNNILALYRSAIFDETWPLDTWHLFSVTNQYDPGSDTLIGTVERLVAPEGTAWVRYQVLLRQQGWAGGGAIWVDDMVLDQVSGPVAPVLSETVPGNLLLARADDGVSFRVTSPSGTTIPASGIEVILNGSSIPTGELTISGSDSDKTVSYAGLTSNTVYSVSIRITDQLGLVTTAAMDFDTWAPAMVIESEDFDYDGGLYILNPIPSNVADPDSYFGRIGVEGVDRHEDNSDGDHIYRPLETGIATPYSNDAARKNYLDAGASDFKVGWFNPGEWVNYTRVIPAGTYNLYARAGGNPGTNPTLTLSRVTGGQGTTEQATEEIGKFTYPAVGWNEYDYVALRDSSDNLLAVDFDGETTLRVTAGGDGDFNFLMLVPAALDLPLISNIQPDGSRPFQAVSAFSFDADSSSVPIPEDGLGLKLNGIDVSSQLVVTGTETSRTATYEGLRPNATYSAEITVRNANGTTSTRTREFDTFSEDNFVVEAEDYDFTTDGTPGQFFADPVPSPWFADNSYYSRQGTEGIDFHDTAGDGDHIYRELDAMATPVAEDYLRQKFVDAATSTGMEIDDYKLGWYGSGEWNNYSRPYPTGTFLVYGRLAGGAGAFDLYLDRVVSGHGTTEQVTERLGRFHNIGAGWQAFEWVPLMTVDLSAPVQIELGGQATLRLTTSGGCDPNFFMLVPVQTDPQLEVGQTAENVTVTFPTRNGVAYQILGTDDLGSGSWTVMDVGVGNGNPATYFGSKTEGRKFYIIVTP